MKPERHHWPDLGTLSALGFGPDAALMNEPKLFVDRRFLGALLAQLDQELGEEACRGTLFQIGLFHGLSDAHRVLQGDFLALRSGLSSAGPPAGPGSATPLAIRLGPRQGGRPSGAIEVPGAWPEGHEADARLARVGPSQRPSCALSAGYTSGWLSGTFDADILVVEDACIAAGHEACGFRAREVEAWRGTGDPRALELVRSVDFGLFRDLAFRPRDPFQDGSPCDPPPPEGHYDPDAASVVHVWGPVMVMPFGSPDDALLAIESLTQDPGTEGVRCVVLDLRDSALDDGLGASALDQVVEAIGAWGAEAILAGVSPLSEAAVEGVEARHLVVRKDLPEAIAIAFQIAEAQSRSL